MKNMKNIFKGVYAYLYDIYDNLSAKSCIVSIGDIMLKRANIDSAQFTTATRLLDVKNFVLFNNADFVYQNIVSEKLWGGVNHDATRGNSSFKKIIKSYQKSGYIKDSVVEVDKSLRLINGTHRTACNLFFEYFEISVKSIGRNISGNNAPFRQLRLGFDPQFITDIMIEFNNIQKMLVETGNTFVILASKESYSSISSELGELVNVLKVSDFEPKEANFGFNGKLVQFSLPCPQYIIKNGVIVSEYAASLKKMYSTRFENLIISESCLEGKKLYDNVIIRDCREMSKLF